MDIIPPLFDDVRVTMAAYFYGSSTFVMLVGGGAARTDIHLGIGEKPDPAVPSSTKMLLLDAR
jgi:hypothetical protein